MTTALEQLYADLAYQSPNDYGNPVALKNLAREIDNGAGVITALQALPNSDAGLAAGDLFWNGGFLCKKV